MSAAMMPRVHSNLLRHRVLDYLGHLPQHFLQAIPWPHKHKHQSRTSAITTRVPSARESCHVLFSLVFWEFCGFAAGGP